MAVIDRRELIASGIGALAPLPGRQTIDPEKGVTAPEDLMKEHGVLNRCLLIYEEALRRLGRAEGNPDMFRHTAELIQLFVERYHEKNEEKYIFPVFKKAGKLIELVRTLEAQHKAGRVLTNQIIRLSDPSMFNDMHSRGQIVRDCQAFIRMYRPHEAREDTVRSQPSAQF